MCVYAYILYLFISCHSNIQREKERIEASIKRQDDKTREQVEERHHQRERDARESEMDVPRRDRDSTSNEKNKLVLFISIVTYNSYYII